MVRKKSATVDLKVRMKEPLRAKIEAAAGARGVSLNAETVDRLERSFATEEWRHEEFGGRGGYEIFRVLGAAASALGSMAGTTNWWKHPGIFTKLANDVCPSMLKMFQKEIAEKQLPKSGTTRYWRLTLDLAELTDEGGKGDYHLAYKKYARMEL